MTDDLPPLETRLPVASDRPEPAGFWESAAAQWAADTVRTDVGGFSQDLRRKLTSHMYGLLSRQGQARVQERNRAVDPMVRDHVYLEDFVMEEFATERPPVGDFPTTREAFDARITAERLRIVNDAEDTTARGSALGAFAGGMARAVADPINIAMMPLGFGGGLMRVVASEMLLGGAAEALSLPREYQVAEELGLEPPDPLARIGIGAAAGGVLGGGAHWLARQFTPRPERAAERAAHPPGVPATQAEAAIDRAEGYMRDDPTPDEMLGTEPDLRPLDGAVGPVQFDYRIQGNASPRTNRVGYVFGRLVEMGYDPHIAAGMVGNGMQESGPGLNSKAIGDNGNAFGIWQWNGPRRQAYLDFAARRGADPGDVDTQIAFLDHELKTTESGAWEKVRQARNAEEAALLFSQHFERPGLPHNANRVAMARAVMRQFDEGRVPKWEGAALVEDGPTTYTGTSRGYTGTGQVSAGDEFRIDVDYKVVDMASLMRASGDLQPRDRSRINSDEWIAATAARLDPAKLLPNPDASSGPPIIGPDGIIESGNGRVAVLDRAYAEFPDRAATYRAQIEAAGFAIPEGVQRPVLVAERRTPLDDAQRQRFVVAAQDSSVPPMTPTEIARTGARRMDAPVLARLNPELPIDHADNSEFVTRVMAGLPRSDRNAMVDKTGALNTPGQRRLREAIFARAWPDDDILSRFTETAPDELKSLMEALDAAAPDWAVLRGEIEAGLVRADMDIGPYVLDAMRMIAAAREASARGGPTIAGALEDLLNQIDLLDGAVSPLTTALVRQFWKGSRAAPAKDIASFLKRYAQDARVAGRTGQMFDDTGPAEVLRKIDPAAFADLPDDLGKTRARAQEPPPQVELPEAGLEDGARSPDVIEADAAAVDDLMSQPGPGIDAASDIANSADGTSMGPNLRANRATKASAEPISRAEFQTSSASTGSQSAPGRSMASANRWPDGLRNSTAGRASQSVNASSLTGESPPSSGDVPNMGASGAEIHTAPARLVSTDPALDAAFAAYEIEMPDGTRRTAREVLADLDADAQFDAFIQGCAITQQGAPA